MYQGFISTEHDLVFLTICIAEALACKGYHIGHIQSLRELFFFVISLPATLSLSVSVFAVNYFLSPFRLVTSILISCGEKWILSNENSLLQLVQRNSRYMATQYIFFLLLPFVGF